MKNILIAALVLASTAAFAEVKPITMPKPSQNHLAVAKIVNVKMVTRAAYAAPKPTIKTVSLGQRAAK